MDAIRKIEAEREIALLELIEKLEDAAVDQASYVNVPGSLAALISAREQVSGAIRQLFTEHAQTLASKEAEIHRLREALETVADWRLPPTGEVWPSGAPVSYESNYGSNGAMDFFRRLARSALNQNQGEPK